MKWFKHDTDAHADAKLKRVRHKYGITGYGLYWYCVELIAGKIDSKNITFELEEDAELIAIEWNLDQLKVEEIMRYFVEIGLFEHENSVITCLKLAKRLDDTNAKNPQIKEILNRLNRTSSELFGETPRNSGQIRLDKNRKEITNAQNAQERSATEKFSVFYEAYPKKRSRGQAEKAFAKLNPSEQLLTTMLESLERAKTSEDWVKSNGQFIPYPATWINAKGWDDEYEQDQTTKEVFV